MRFRSKPVEIEAIQFTGWDSYSKMTEEWGKSFAEESNFCSVLRRLEIKTLEGIMRADLNDWIIKGLRGEFYPCKPDVFDRKYALVQAEKLVRDKMPEICEANAKAGKPGWTPMSYRIVESWERLPMLIDKLREEVDELEKASTDQVLYRDKITEEIADVIEVVTAIGEGYFNIPFPDVLNSMQKKAFERGRFRAGIVWDGKR